METESLRERNRTARRNRILDELVESLSNRDISEVSVDEVAAAASVSRATVFNYFATKREMLLAVAKRESDRLEKRTEAELSAGAEPLSVIDEVMYDLVATSFSACSASWQVLRSLLAEPADSTSPVWTLLLLVEGLLRRAQDQGSLRAELDAAACARAIIGTYLCELFAVTANRGGSASIDRSEFNRSASILTEGWAP